MISAICLGCYGTSAMVMEIGNALKSLKDFWEIILIITLNDLSLSLSLSLSPLVIFFILTRIFTLKS
jgi:hypothetical protein